MRRSRQYKPLRSEDNLSEENWLVSYADMMTLLFIFFVVIASFSTPDAQKLEKLQSETSESMGVEYINPYDTLKQELKKTFKEHSILKNVKIVQLPNGLNVIFKSQNFFASSSAKITPKTLEVLKSIGTKIAPLSKKLYVHVEGHTDDLPIVTKQYPSNWELSLRRASEVVRVFESQGVDHQGLRPVGLADTEPFLKLSKEMSKEEKGKARSQNRRIVIKIKNKFK